MSVRTGRAGSMIALSLLTAVCGKKQPDAARTAASASAAASDAAPAKFRARFETTAGDFVIEVQRDWAPQGADRFYNLVKSGYYDGVRFFRVISGFMAQFGIQDITPASGLGNYLVVPQNRTPDFIVWPTDGSNGSQAVVYGSVPLSKQVEHGGRGDADQNILMLLEGPGIPVGYTSSQHVWLMQLASTVATTMCLSLPTATLPALPGTSAPENCQ